MAELSGAPWRALAKVHVVNGGLGTRFFAVGVGISSHTASGDQSSWTGAPGTTLTLTYHTGTDGAAPPETPNSVTINVRVPDGAQIGAGNWTNPSDGETRTFHFDNNPVNESADTNRAGCFEIFIDVDRNAGLNQYRKDSRGTNTGSYTVDWAQGYLRAPVTLSSHSVSDVSLGGAEPTKWAYGDSLFLRATLDATWVRSATLQAWLEDSGGTQKGTSKSSTTTSTTRDFSWSSGADLIDNTFAASEANYTVELDLPTNSFGGDQEYIWAASGHEAGWTRDSDDRMRYVDRATIDPRLTFTHLSQIEDNSWSTPPTSSSTQGTTRSNSQRMFLAERAVNSRSTGINSLAWDVSLQDQSAAPESPVTRSESASQAQGGEDGWSSAFLTWSSQLPSGTWRKTVTLTTAAATGLEVTNTADYELEVASAIDGLDPIAFALHGVISQR